MKGYQCCIRSENVQTNEKRFPWLSINSTLKKCKYPERMGNKPYHGQIPNRQTKPANSDPQGWSCTPNYATKQFLQKSVCFEGSNETTTGKNMFSNFPFWPSHFHWHQPQGPLLWQGTMSHLRSYNTASPIPWNDRKGKVRFIASARSIHGDSQRYDQPFFVKNNEKLWALLEYTPEFRA